jgi:glycosyltransferase involved in cell wall biosynthesis
MGIMSTYLRLTWLFNLHSKFTALRRILRQHGVTWVLAFLAQRFAVRWLMPFYEVRARKKIEAWAIRQKGRIHIYLSTVDWRYPYRQRPQHIVDELVRRGTPLIYVTPACGYDRVLSASLAEHDNLLLTPHCYAALDSSHCPIVHAPSTLADIDDQLVTRIRDRGGLIVYDYIDALDDAISSGPLSPRRRAVHRRLLHEQPTAVIIASSDVLQFEVARARERGFALVTNGVQVERFRGAERGRDLRPDFESILKLGKPIIGYYGTFAAWFDYDLVNRFARARPQYTIALIGPDLDGTRARLSGSFPNLVFLPAMAYDELPRHAAWFDVCIIPFLLNEITYATSPLKVFEYMAMGKPIVSTDLPECRKYRSVFIGRTPEDFLHSVDRALALAHDGISPAIIRAEAEAHSWSNKVDEILRVVAEQTDPDERLRGWQLSGPPIKLVQPEPDHRPIGTADRHTPFSTRSARLPN